MRREGKKILQDVTSLHARLYLLFAQMAEDSGSVSTNLLIHLLVMHVTTDRRLAAFCDVLPQLARLCRSENPRKNSKGALETR